MKIYTSNRLAIPLLIFSVLVFVSLACSITVSTPPPEVSTAAPAPTGIYVAPDEITVRPETEEPYGSLWVGMAGTSVINFCVHGNQIDTIHFVMSITCKDKQTGETYDNLVNLSLYGGPLTENVAWLLEPNGWFTGGYEYPEFPYKDLLITFNGHLQGSQGRVYILLESDNEVAVCHETKFLVDGIQVQRSNAPCVP
jgi:hypothetical protein